MSINEGLAAAEYLRCMWLSITRPDFLLPSPYLLNDPLPLGSNGQQGRFRSLDPSDQWPSQDRHCAVDVAVVRSSLRTKATGLRWVDGAKQQITDALKKKNGNADLLRAVLARGEFTILEASLALQFEKQERERRKARARIQPPPGLPPPVEAMLGCKAARDYDTGASQHEDDWEHVEPEHMRKLRECKQEGG